MSYQCPLCQVELREQVGTVLHPGDKDYGITLDCANVLCVAKEVMGHGDKAKDAFQIILDKYTRRKKD